MTNDVYLSHMAPKPAQALQVCVRAGPGPKLEHVTNSNRGLGYGLRGLLGTCSGLIFLLNFSF